MSRTPMRPDLDIFLLGFSEEDSHCGNLQSREHKIYLLQARRATMERKRMRKEARGFFPARETEQGRAHQEATVKYFFSIFFFRLLEIN